MKTSAHLSDSPTPAERELAAYADAAFAPAHTVASGRIHHFCGYAHSSMTVVEAERSRELVGLIDAEGIHTKNASRALLSGPVTLENLDPTPKNPVVANFFTQMGRSEELGSGTRNLYKFSRLYTGRDPVLEDGDQFSAFVPVPP